MIPNPDVIRTREIIDALNRVAASVETLVDIGYHISSRECSFDNKAEEFEPRKWYTPGEIALKAKKAECARCVKIIEEHLPEGPWREHLVKLIHNEG